MRTAVLAFILGATASAAAPSSSPLPLHDLAALAPIPSLVPWDEVARLLERDTQGMVIVTPEATEVVVARIEKDGSRVVGCVDSAEAAALFLKAPKVDREQ